MTGDRGRGVSDKAELEKKLVRHEIFPDLYLVTFRVDSLSITLVS
jgi:hypothetical protein